jgi:hypothetical protein
VPAGVVYEGYRNRPRQEEWIDGIRTVRVWTYLAANRGRVRRGLNFLSYLASATIAAPFVRDVDLVIATSPQFFAGWAGAPAARFHGAPFVLEIRDLWPESIAAVGALRQGRIMRALERLERALYAAPTTSSRSATATATSSSRAACRPRRSTSSRTASTPTSSRRAPRPRRPRPARAAGRRLRRRLRRHDRHGERPRRRLRAARRLKDAGRDDVRFLLVGDGAVRPELEASARAQG